jgi:hypothetical protein
VEKEEAVALVVALALAGLFSHLRWQSYLRFLERAGAENLDAASKAASAYPVHDNVVARIVEAWPTARRRN